MHAPPLRLKVNIPWQAVVCLYNLIDIRVLHAPQTYEIGCYQESG